MALISFVLPVYNESGNLHLLYRKLLDDVVNSPRFDHDAEFVYVNDGSRDDSLAQLRDLAADDPRVKVVDLSRNYGHQMALTAGLDHAAGDAVIMMDTDLQDPPAVCLDLLDRWTEGFDVAYAQRRSRKDTVFKRVTANAFYRVLAWASEVQIPRNTGDFRLIDRKVVDALKLFPERARFIRGLVSAVGFRQTPVLFDRDERYSGESGYPLRKMLRFAADGILAFSTVPLKLIRTVGWVVSLLSLLGIVYVLLGKLLLPENLVPGWAFIVIAVLGVGGIQIIMLSVLGSYIGRIYAQVQARPLYLVGSLYGFESPPEERVKREQQRPPAPAHVVNPAGRK
ncbi:glycosyltransferase family 2 protein [Rhodococcus ruber]|uniref:glycosyltransferase family 2 protein n=1 Tax=Rhodococcus ruber TaxID=1830 RepID=UPI0007CD74F1|nr:glycosyltransferase family 2 protein [Rhodococcus ruber]AWG97325.1 glycosyltransferase [Rhodococcus ruber]